MKRSNAYLLAVLTITLLVLAATLVHRADFVHTLLSQPILPASPSEAAPQAVERKIAAEHERGQRQQLLTTTAAEQAKIVAERRQLFGQEPSYVIAEGISGTEDRYIAPKAEAVASAPQPDIPSAETNAASHIAVQQMVASTEDITSILPAPLPPSSPQSAPLQEQTAAPTPPVQEPLFAQPESALPASQPVQTQAMAQQVPCSAIRQTMDEADAQLFQRAMHQAEGVATPWKGPSGSYLVTPAAIKGNCREYSIQASIQGRELRCFATCIAPTNAPASATSNPSSKQIIINSMSSSDQDALIRALRYQGPISWRSQSGIFYTVSPVHLGNPCREYHVQANINGQIFQYLESNCE